MSWTVFTAKGERQMTTTISEEHVAAQGTATAEQPKPTKKARAAARPRKLASAKATSGKQTSLSKRAAKAARKAATVVRDGSKTANALDLLQRPGEVAC